ncbi:aminomethyltransferase beta-barrel domain-containing protein, partial [Ralstonia solanacearum]|uniref:aminomethyltransferase beta-barrel domain-containing protein n=2 Tax=Ralstonia solanacearum TaxID=305 RepID=UPI0005AC1BF9
APPPAEGTHLAAKTRYRQVDAPCTVARATDGTLALAFTEAQWAVTPGQSAVLYDGDVCLGGGIIACAEAAVAERAVA